MNRRNRDALTSTARLMADSGIQLTVFGAEGPQTIEPEAIPAYIEGQGSGPLPDRYPYRKTGRPAKNHGAEA